MKCRNLNLILLSFSLLFIPSMSKGEDTLSPGVNESMNVEYWEQFVGTIGPYKVIIQHDYGIGENGPWDTIMYKYTSVKVNNGDWILCDYADRQGQYTIWKEKINGRHTGTFRIIINDETITGTFTNSKGQKYKVYATLKEGWGINGAY